MSMFKFSLYEKKNKTLYIGETILDTLYLLDYRENNEELERSIRKTIEILEKLKEPSYDIVMREIRENLMKVIEVDEDELVNLIDNVIKDLNMKVLTRRVNYLLSNLLEVVSKMSLIAIRELER